VDKTKGHILGSRVTGWGIASGWTRFSLRETAALGDRSANVKGGFSTWPVDDLVDNGMSISPKPLPAWLPLQCSWKEQAGKNCVPAPAKLVYLGKR
jgi:hypothetical protein